VDGLAIYTTSYASAGTHTLTAVYPGDATHEGSTSLPFPEKVRNTTTVSLLGSPNPVLGGSFVTYTATVTSPQGGTPSGTVDFTEGGTTVGSGTLAGGVATFTTGYISASSHTLIATYDGDPTFSGSTSSPFTETVINGTFTYLASSRNPIAIGSPVTYTATVESFGTPTGVVTFKEGSSTLGSVALSGGVATLTTSYDAAGVHVITAEYGGAVTYAASTSAPLTQEVVAIGLLANDAGIFEGNLGRRTFSMTVSLNAPSTLPVSVHYQTQSASARAGSDYLDVRGTLVFAPGQTSKTVTTSVIGDRLRERNEVFLLVLSAATNATLVRSRGMETILNDD
jgi:hypothetical protein